MNIEESDSQIIEWLFHQYFDRLYSLIFYKVGGNRDIAEDIVQDTFLAATKSIKNFKHKSNPYTWLVSIAYHKINDYYRKKQTKQKHYGQVASLESMDESKLGMDGRHHTDNIETKESSDAIREILYQLPPDYRIVLILKYIEEMSVNEISTVLRRSPKSCEALLFRARNALRARLDNKQ